MFDTVPRYYKDSKLILRYISLSVFRYPHLPCLQVGQEQKHTYLPLEVSTLLVVNLIIIIIV